MRALYAYSPLEDSWCLVTQLSHERASCGIAPCNNRLYITGGRDEKNEVIATVLCWDPEAQKLTEECVLPRGVSHHGSVTIRKSYTHIRRIVPGAVSVWRQDGELESPQILSVPASPLTLLQPHFRPQARVWGHASGDPLDSLWENLGSHSLGSLETGQKCLHDLPQEGRWGRVIFSIQDPPTVCQLLCQALPCMGSFNLVSGSYHF